MHQRLASYCSAVSPSTDTLTCTSTSVCSAIPIEWSPTVFSGPCGSRIIARSTSKPRPFDARLLRDLEHEPFELGAFLLGGRKRLRLRVLELGALLFEFGEVFGSGPLRLALRQQVVAGKAVLHFDHVTEPAQIDDLFQKNHLHGGIP